MNKNLTDLEQLERLAGKPTVMKIMVKDVEEEIRIRQIKTGKIPQLMKAAGGMIYSLTNAAGEFNLNSMLVLYAEESLDTLAVLIEKDRAFVDEMDIDDTVEVMTACLEANADFFVRRVLPSLSVAILKGANALKDRKIDLVKLAGQTQLNTSSQPDTTKPTSGSTDTESSSSSSKQPSETSE